MNNRGRFDMSTPWWFREEGPGSTSPEPGPGAEDEEVPCRCTDALADAACRTHGVLAFLSGLGNPGPTTKDGTDE